MRKLLFPILVVCLFGGPLSSPAQAPATDAKELQVLIDNVRAQQQQIAANQTKIDEKLAGVIEAIRQARIYAGRGK